MKRLFNIAGPCNVEDHYMIDASRRLGKEIFQLIDNKEYFVIQAARQTGKTTLLLELTKQLNQAGHFHSLYCSLETAQGIEDAKVGIPCVISALKNALEGHDLPNATTFGRDIDMSEFSINLQKSLREYCQSLDKPLVLFFDEADCLVGQTLISFLRQLRLGYINRANIPFVHSLALIGMRYIRDYRDEYRLSEHTLGSSSPFNITAAAMTLRNFTRDEIAELYAQHTADTSQDFESDAIGYVWDQTQGQPWLVNAIAREAINLTPENMKRTIANDDVKTAIQTLVKRRDTHFDSLLARLREDRVRRIIEPVIIGEMGDIFLDSDDYSYVKDLGLIRDDRGKIEPANPIYGEIIVRTLNSRTQMEMGMRGSAYIMPRYLNGDIIDIDYLLRDFQAFWRINSGIWQEKYKYKEAAPLLILQAFLQRIINAGGQIVREMAAATGRVDLCVVYRDRKYPIELKIRYDDETYAEGLEQTASYMEILGCDKGWLVVFDRRKTPSWDERLFVRKELVNGKTVTIYGC